MQRRFSWIIPAVIAGIAVARCAAFGTYVLAGSQTAAPLSEPAAKTQEDGQIPELSDREIRLAVENELLASQAIKSRRIRVVVEDGIVTLAGRMRNLLDEDIAVGLTRRVRGVASVIDQLEVNRTDCDDATLLKDVQAALTSDPGMRDLNRSREETGW